MKAVGLHSLWRHARTRVGEWSPSGLACLVAGLTLLVATVHAQEAPAEKQASPEALDRILRETNFVLRKFDPLSRVGCLGDAYPSTLWVFAAPESGESDGDDAAQPLEAALRLALADADSKVRLKAVAELPEVGGDQAAAALAAAALFDQDSSVREEAVYGLGEMGDETTVQILEQALMDPDEGVRETAIEAFTDIGGDDAVRALAFALSDEDPSLRADAVHALGEIGGEAAIRALQQALADEQSSVRKAAAAVLTDARESP